jgi:hypothetical protein
VKRSRSSFSHAQVIIYKIIVENMVLRSICRVPMGVFDEYRALYFKHPRTMNFFMLYTTVAVFLFFGKGFEKLALQAEQTKWENSRRLRRAFIPYSLVSYKWRFPVNQ